MFDDICSNIIIYGHNHSRNICRGDKFYINVGSLGCPAQDKNTARAGILKIEKGCPEIRTLDIEYDAKSVIRSIDSINYPDADNIKKYFYGIW